MSQFGASWRTGGDVYLDPDPARLRGLLWRRVFGYSIDVVLIAAISGLISLVAWPLWPVVFTLIPLAYHSLQIGGSRSATVGQRMFGIEVRRLDGGRPQLLQALVQTVLFYVTVTMLTPLVLIVAVFNRRRRALHDILAGTLTLRRGNDPEILLSPGGRP
jgi:uncharacterized RDD family membrane protein YckC